MLLTKLTHQKFNSTPHVIFGTKSQFDGCIQKIDLGTL